MLAFARRGQLGELRACREWGGVPVRYPAYFYVPRVLASTRGFTMAASLLPAVAAFARQHRPRAILATWGYPDGFAAVLLGRMLGLPVTIKVHGSDVESLDEGGAKTALALWGFRHAARVVSVSRYLKDRLVAHGVDAAKIAVVTNGVDAGLFQMADRSEARRELGLDEASRLLLYVGNLKADKGLLELVDPVMIEACREAGATIAIVGGGPLRERLERGIGARGLADVVRLLGRLPPARIARWMNATDGLCLPSHHEGIPNVILEALSCGVPVLATRVGGIPEVVSPAGGVLVEAKSAPALAEGLRRLFGVHWNRDAVRASSTAGSWPESAALLQTVIPGTES